MHGPTPQGVGMGNVGPLPQGPGFANAGYMPQSQQHNPSRAQGDNQYPNQNLNLLVNQQSPMLRESNQQPHLQHAAPFPSNYHEQGTVGGYTQHQPYMQGSQPSMPQARNMNNPMIETVHEDDFIRQPLSPTAIEGIGIIDARTSEDPHMTADQQATSIQGAPGSAHGRVALLQQALVCDLCHFLVQGVLENPTLAKVRDSASAKVHAIDLVKLLCKDPGYGLKFKMILDELPSWKKYVSQDHSLLINKQEQKADYFLTNGEPSDTKLLTEE